MLNFGKNYLWEEEDFLAEGCAMIGTILTMVEVKYGEEEREEFLNIAMEMGRKEIEQIMREFQKNHRYHIDNGRSEIWRRGKGRIFKYSYGNGTQRNRTNN
ncbi:hypothetical protein DXA21_21525, partial [Parabacteroides distasonis]